VLIGVGQVTNARARRDVRLSKGTPRPHGRSPRTRRRRFGAGRRTLETIDEVVAVSSFTWHTADPALLVARRLGLRGVTTRLTSVGGNTPQKLIHESARRMLAAN